MNIVKYDLPAKLGKLFSLMSVDYGRKGNNLLRDLLQRSQYSVEEGVVYDNLDGGIDGHSVHFLVPRDIYFEIIDNLKDIGSEIARRVNELKSVPHEFVSDIYFDTEEYQPVVTEQKSEKKTQKAKSIPTELRQDIIDYLKIEKIHWSGCLSDLEFLNRLYDLTTYESNDFRYQNAKDDIWQHTVNNNDYDEDWIYTDLRFDLLNTDDAKFVAFICEIIHPVVRLDSDESIRIVDAVNKILLPTTWQIVVTRYIGEKPIYGAIDHSTIIDTDPTDKIDMVAVADTELDRIWHYPGYYRVFLSHKVSYKSETAKLKDALLKYGITCFVAHEDIEPTRAWQNEIENALYSMEAFVALLTPDYHDSNWTDQEIGVAIGRRLPIISVNLGIVPYGFIGKDQALNGLHLNATMLAEKICNLFSKFVPGSVRSVTEASDRNTVEALVDIFENAGSYDQANQIMKQLTKLSSVSPEILARIEKAPMLNPQVEKAFEVKKRLPDLIKRLKEQIIEPSAN